MSHRGALDRFSGTLDLLCGMLDLLCGMLDLFRGTLDLSRGMLDRIRGTLILLSGALDLSGGALQLLRGTLQPVSRNARPVSPTAAAAVAAGDSVTISTAATTESLAFAVAEGDSVDESIDSIKKDEKTRDILLTAVFRPSILFSRQRGAPGSTITDSARFAGTWCSGFQGGGSPGWKPKIRDQFVTS